MQDQSFFFDQTGRSGGQRLGWTLNPWTVTIYQYPSSTLSHNTIDPVIWPPVTMGNRNNVNVILFNRVKNLVWELVKKVPPHIVLLFRPCGGIFLNPADSELDLLSTSCAQAWHFKFIVFLCAVHFHIGEFVKKNLHSYWSSPNTSRNGIPWVLPSL